jgi:hypothetical protein
VSLDVIPYRYRGRRYPWAERTIRRAQAIHGEPLPTCTCGHPLEFCGDRVFPCPACTTRPVPGSGPVPRCGDCGYVLDPVSARLMGATPCTCPPKDPYR